MEFKNLNVNKKILDAITAMGFVDMTPIQEKAIPLILEGKNVIGEAHTGTGKTAAFGIPLFEKMDPNKREIQSLIMAPTRELAIQIVEELRRIGKMYNYNIASLVGGMSIENQAKELRSMPKIIVCTPGRLIDHLERKRLNLDSISTFVLDEVDEMLKVGFKEDIDKIISLLPADKQTLFFSATISQSILSVANSVATDYVHVSVNDGNVSTDSIDQYCVITRENNKFATLTKLLDINNPKLAIVFGRTKRRADEVSEALLKCDYKVAALHGDLSQGQRNAVLRKFKNNEIDILVATDVAARGLDVTGVSHVYNFDLPQEVEYYVHRIGRTGRAFNTGISYTFVRDSEIPHVEKIMKETQAKIKIIDSPSASDLKDSNRDRLMEKIDKALTDVDREKNKEVAAYLTESYSIEDLSYALIALGMKNRNVNDITLTGEPPVRIKGGFNRRGDRNSDRRGSNRGESRDRRSFGNRSYGDRKPSGDRPAGDRKPFGDRRPSGNRPFGDRKPSGDRSFGDRPKKYENGKRTDRRPNSFKSRHEDK